MTGSPPPGGAFQMRLPGAFLLSPRNTAAAEAPLLVSGGGGTLDHEYRQKLRWLVSEEQKRRYRAFREAGSCATCGVPYDDQTPGCSTCWNRAKDRRQRMEQR